MKQKKNEAAAGSRRTKYKVFAAKYTGDMNLFTQESAGSSCTLERSVHLGVCFFFLLLFFSTIWNAMLLLPNPHL